MPKSLKHSTHPIVGNWSNTHIDIHIRLDEVLRTCFYRELTNNHFSQIILLLIHIKVCFAMCTIERSEISFWGCQSIFIELNRSFNCKKYIYILLTDMLIGEVIKSCFLCSCKSTINLGKKLLPFWLINQLNFYSIS